MPKLLSLFGFSVPSHTAVTVFALTFGALVVAGVTTSFQAQLVPGEVSSSSSFSSSSSEEPYRECSARGTMFEGMRNLDKVQSLFATVMSQLTEERQKILTDASHWQCDETTPTPMPRLMQVAEKMPGWYYRKSNFLSGIFGVGYTKVLRPVTFDAFPSIVGEYLREYECAISELQGQTLSIVSTNDDYAPGTEFCCTTEGCELVSVAETRCTGAPTEHPQCNNECELPYMNQLDIAKRPTTFHARALPERSRARFAVERTIATLRSYEMEYETLRQLTCTQRASLDLLNETTLLAEAASCLPKIWDSATSLHDPKN